MKALLAVCLIVLSFSANARDVQRAECVGPATAPVSVVYFHGLFPNKNVANNFYLTLESNNRDQLEALAQKLNIRIAIPLAAGIDPGGYRDWRVGKTDQVFAAAEAEAIKTCNAPLAQPRTLLGFSMGGYFTRDLALECDAVTKDYSLLFMSGAQPRAPASVMKGCTNLVVASGTEDSSTDVCQTVNKKTICTPFKTVAAGMQARYPNLEIETFVGGHQIPSDDLLTKYFP